MEKFNITEDEKNRILGLHKSQILSEQGSADINMDRMNRDQLKNVPIKKPTVYPMDKEKQLVALLPKFGFTKKIMDNSDRLTYESPKVFHTINFIRKNLSSKNKLGLIYIELMGDEDRFLSNRMETTIFEENPNTFQKFLENSLKARLF
jgi:hypothetical protein